MSGPLRQHAGDYLQMRRRLGYQLQTTGALVRRFADHCDAAGITLVTIQVAADWAAAPADRSSRYRWLRLNAVRGFAGYLHAIDPSHQVPAPGLLPSRYRRPVPYVLSEPELGALRSATATLRPHVQAVTYRTLIGLMEVTGIRPCEAIRMESTDIDPAAGVMTVHGKGGKQRLLPLHPTAVAALADYASLRDQAFPSRTDPGFFTGPAGTRLTVQQAGQVFTRLAAAAGLPEARAQGRAAAPGVRRRPTLVSLRHTFTVTTLAGWLSDGTSVEPNLPLLSAWLGHKDPRSTYWYIEAVPELLQAASSYALRQPARDVPPPSALPLTWQRRPPGR